MLLQSLHQLIKLQCLDLFFHVARELLVNSNYLQSKPVLSKFITIIITMHIMHIMHAHHHHHHH
jgi:hypothetical protein